MRRKFVDYVNSEQGGRGGLECCQRTHRPVELFLRGLNPGIDTNHLREILQSYGSVLSLEVCGTYCFVVYSDIEEACSLVEGGPIDCNGVSLHPEYSRRNRLRPPSNRTHPTLPKKKNLHSARQGGTARAGRVRRGSDHYAPVYPSSQYLPAQIQAVGEDCPLQPVSDDGDYLPNFTEGLDGPMPSRPSPNSLCIPVYGPHGLHGYSYQPPTPKRPVHFTEMPSIQVEQTITTRVKLSWKGITYQQVAEEKNRWEFRF